MNKLFLGSIKKFSKLVFALVALSLAYDYVIEKQSRSLDIKLSIESAKERVVYKFQNITVIQRPSEFDVVLIDDFKNLAETGEELELEQSHNTCPYKPPSLKGPIDKIDTIEHSMEELETKFASLSPGGRWKPRECESRSRVAIIVPYRDRERHLRLFLNHMHPFLQRQQLDYGIYIIEEVPGIPFNRALLMNIGFNEAMKDYNWTCFIFHDVDLVPEDDRNLYHCPRYPRHMSSHVDSLGYELPYRGIMGGVTAIRTSQFQRINGFSNRYFGWGGEDDDLATRVLYQGLHITRYPSYMSRYKMLLHEKDTPSKKRFQLLGDAINRFKTDGLNSLEYQVIKKERRSLFSWFLVSFKVQ